MKGLPKEIILWLDDIQVPVKVELEPTVTQQKGNSEKGWDKRDGGIAHSIYCSDGEGFEDDDFVVEESWDCVEFGSEMELEDDEVRRPNLNFKTDDATLHLDSMGWIHIHFNEPSVTSQWQLRPRKYYMKTANKRPF